MQVVDEKVDVVIVGDKYYLADDWVAAYNTTFLWLLEQRVASVSTVRKLMRVVRDTRKKALAEVVLQRTSQLILRDGNPVAFSGDTMFVAARFPGLSDPPGKVGVD